MGSPARNIIKHKFLFLEMNSIHFESLMLVSLS